MWLCVLVLVYICVDFHSDFSMALDSSGATLCVYALVTKYWLFAPFAYTQLAFVLWSFLRMLIVSIQKLAQVVCWSAFNICFDVSLLHTHIRSLAFWQCHRYHNVNRSIRSFSFSINTIFNIHFIRTDCESGYNKKLHIFINSFFPPISKWTVQLREIIRIDLFAWILKISIKH